MEREVWHCIFCGRHWVGGPPSVTLDIMSNPESWTDKNVLLRTRPDHVTVHACPYCREYKGLERCDPKTCDLAYVFGSRKPGEYDEQK